MEVVKSNWRLQNVKPTYNFNKYYDGEHHNGIVTGRSLDLKGTPLGVLDFDIKILSFNELEELKEEKKTNGVSIERIEEEMTFIINESREETRTRVLKEIEDSVSSYNVLKTVTMSGGLHYYFHCPMNKEDLTNLGFTCRNVKVKKDIHYDIDIFFGVFDEKANQVILPGSFAKKEQKNTTVYGYYSTGFEGVEEDVWDITRVEGNIIPFNEQIVFNNYENIPRFKKNVRIEDVMVTPLLELDETELTSIFEYISKNEIRVSMKPRGFKRKQTFETRKDKRSFGLVNKTNFEESSEENFEEIEIDKSVFTDFIENMKDVSIHNYCCKQYTEEVGLLHILSVIKGMPNTLKEWCLQEIHTMNLTFNARNQIERNQNINFETIEITSSKVLSNISRHWNPNGKEILFLYDRKKEMTNQVLDLDYVYNDFLKTLVLEPNKIWRKEEIYQEISKFVIFVCSTQSFYIRVGNEQHKQYVIVSRRETIDYFMFEIWIENSSKEEENKPKKVCLNLLLKDLECLSNIIKIDVDFSSENVYNLHLFEGWMYQPQEDNDEIISKTLEHIQRMFPNEEHLHYVLNWVSYIIQNPGQRTNVAIILIGNAGCGKTWFSDLVSKLLNPYSIPNVDSLEHLIGKFTPLLTNPTVFICTNEFAQTSNRSISQKLKTLITESTFISEDKGKNAKPIHNYMNMMFTTNIQSPMGIDVDDRRFAVFDVTNTQTVEWYQDLYLEQNKKNYFETLMNYFMRRDLEKFNTRIYPITEIRNSLCTKQLPSNSSLERWMESFHDYSKVGYYGYDLYKIYQSFCEEEDLQVLSEYHFTRFRMKYFTAERVNVYDGTKTTKVRKYFLI